MLQVTPKQKIFIAVQHIDFRKGIDGIVAICHQKFQLDTLSGHVFIFRNRKASALRILVYDEQGYWLCHKRLSCGRFKYWPTATQSVLMLTVAQLQVLLYNGDPKTVHTQAPWRHTS